MQSVFFGASEFVIPVLEILRDKFSLSLVITTEKDSGAVTSFCKLNNIDFLQTDRLDDGIIEQIKIKGPDVGIVADFGLIIPKKLIDVFPHGILNIHPSLLPKYRGSTPVQTALLNGDKETGVSIIKIDEKMDHGPILAQDEFEIEGSPTSKELLPILFKLGANLLNQTLVDYLEDVVKPLEQDENMATYTKILSKQDGFLNPQTLKIGNLKLNIEQAVRALYPWPGVWTKEKINNKEVVIKLLPKEMIQVEGKNPQSYKDFANGYKEGKEILKKFKSE